VNPRIVRALADKMLAALDLSAAELSILLTDDAGIRVLNRTHRGKDKPTDVLSFPLDEDADGPDDVRLLGDVVLSIDTAERQARSRRRDLMEELRFLLAHGILHLIGYDHGTRPEKKRMDAACRRLVRAAALPALIKKEPVRRAKVRKPPRK
jgi:probable rRNA maturation factor